jgi:hypothetical protein
MTGAELAARLLACPRMRAAVAGDSARNRAAILAGALALAGCSVTLYSAEWDSRPPMTAAECDTLTETEARAIPACAAFDYKESRE